MFKRPLIFALLALLLAVSVSVGAAQDAAQDATPEATLEISADIPQSLSDQMAALEQVTQNLRGLTAKSPVDHQFPTRQEVKDYLRATYAREFPPEAFDKLERFYVALGLLPADVNLQDVYLGLLDSQVAGFYDPETKTMNVIPITGDSVGSRMSFTEEITYVHEFNHALQDQYFDLNTLMSSDVEMQPDRSLAVTSLVEGDATATMTVYAQNVEMQNPFAAIGMLIEGVQAGNLSLPSGIPPILLDELLFPYDAGLNFILALYKSGGYDAINAAFANPPSTSEQILHPAKYIAGEGAQAVTLGEASAALGEGWQPVWESSLGEFYLRAHLETELSDTEASAAAAGWGGDDFRVYAGGDQLAWELRLTWDTPADQSEFEGAYTDYAVKRFDSAATDGCWQGDAAALCLVPGGTATNIVSAPTLAQAQALSAGM